MNSVSVGCNYRLPGSQGYMTMHGRVSDFQLWDSVLPVQEMLEITSCQAFPEGTLLTWRGTAWHLNSSLGTARREEMDLELGICINATTSLALLPHSMAFDPAALHTCTKLSGEAAAFSTESELDTISLHLARWDSPG
jgi:hypothetical protein